MMRIAGWWVTGGIAGFTLAINSSAGPVAQWGFGLLALAWLASTLNAYRHVRDRNFAQHRAWMIRSYALALFFLTFSLIHPMVSATAASRTTVYAASILASVACNLGAAELWIRWKVSGSPAKLGQLRLDQAGNQVVR